MRLEHRQLAAAAIIAGVTAPHLATAFALGEPFFVVVGAIALAVAAVAIAFDRWWAVVPAVALSLVGIPLVAASAPEMFHRFDSAIDFVTLLGILAAIAAALAFCAIDLASRFRRSNVRASRVATRIFAGGFAAFVAVAGASTFVTITADRATVSAADRVSAHVLVYDRVEIVDGRDIQARAGQPVRIVVDNEDPIAHDFVIKGTGVKVDLGPKDEKLVEIIFDEPGEYDFSCTLPGHNGMSGTVYVR